MSAQTESKRAKPRTSAAAAPKQEYKETPEQKAKRIAYETRNAASNAAFMAAYRAAHPLPEIVTGSPYQAANEAWRNGQPGTDGLFDHWTSSK
jgi:hypothetical protein